MQNVTQVTINKQTPAIATNGLTKVYPNGTRAVSNVSLTVAATNAITASV